MEEWHFQHLSEKVFVKYEVFLSPAWDTFLMKNKENGVSTVLDERGLGAVQWNVVMSRFERTRGKGFCRTNFSFNLCLILLLLFWYFHFQEFRFSLFH